MSRELAAAYQACLDLSQQHYENFPVASRILPKRLRLPIAVIYSFARQADDFADEGDLTDQERLAKLADYDNKLKQISSGITLTDPLFIALADVIKQHQLPIQLFHDLITAFKMDVTKKRFATHDEVMYYCQHSANPVGRLLLHLNQQTSDINLQQSDAICSALQLINFLQDMQQDYHEMQRIYIPLDEMQRFGVTEDHFKNRLNDEAMQQLFSYQVQRAKMLMHSGAPLGQRLKGRFGFEIRLIINGGLGVLDRLAAQQQDVFTRPRLRKRDWIRMIFRTISGQTD